jgi:hypothetical protein
MSLWKRPPVRLTDRDIGLLAFRYANPHLTIRQITSILLLQPGELSRLLRLKEARWLLHDFATGYRTCNLDTWRLPRAFCLQVVAEREEEA